MRNVIANLTSPQMIPSVDTECASVSCLIRASATELGGLSVYCNLRRYSSLLNAPSPTFLLILVQSKSKHSRDMQKYRWNCRSVKSALNSSQLFLWCRRLRQQPLFLIIDTLCFQRKLITWLWSTRPTKSSSTESNIHCRNSFFLIIILLMTTGHRLDAEYYGGQPGREMYRR